MPDVVDAALENQRRNIETRTGRSFDDWLALARASGHERHGALLAWLKTEHGVSHGDANRIALDARRAEPPAGAARDDLDAIYSGAKAALRPLHERVVSLAQGFGDDISLSPKQAYISLRRTKQFATVGPASGGRLEVGLNLKGVEPVGRLEAATGMCTHRVRLAATDDLNDEVRGWLREAYERACWPTIGSNHRCAAMTTASMVAAPRGPRGSGAPIVFVVELPEAPTSLVTTTAGNQCALDMPNCGAESTRCQGGLHAVAV